MSRQVSPSTDKIYGLQRVARLWGVSRATLYRHRRPASVASASGLGHAGRRRMTTWWQRSACS